MKLNEMIDLLNQDLANEYMHWHFYMFAACVVQGFHRAELSEFFLEQAAGEMKHIEQFSKLIVGLGGVPTTIPAALEIKTPYNESLLILALEIEDRVVANYVERIEDTDELDDRIHAKYIELFLEDQILDSRADADHIREMLKF